MMTNGAKPDGRRGGAPVDLRALTDAGPERWIEFSRYYYRRTVACAAGLAMLDIFARAHGRSGAARCARIHRCGPTRADLPCVADIRCTECSRVWRCILQRPESRGHERPEGRLTGG